MNHMSTSFDECSVFHCADVSLKLVRIARLKKLQADSKLSGQEFCDLIGCKPNQLSDLLHGRASFGEKVARKIEEKAGKPPGWLDESPGWPFAIDFERFDKLEPDQKKAIEGTVTVMVQGFESGKKDRPSGGPLSDSDPAQRWGGI